jgi:hypothetical protein
MHARLFLLLIPLFQFGIFVTPCFSLTAEVKDHLGSPALFVNGAPQVPMMFWGHASDAARAKKSAGEAGFEKSVYTQQACLAASVGIHLHSFETLMPWPKPGEAADFSDVDLVFEAALEADPNALLLPRFSANAPIWWLDQHPGHEMVYSDGGTPETIRTQSMGSKVWRREAVQNLRVFVRHCEEKFGDHMLGYHPCGQHTAEWFYERSWEPVYHGFEEAFRSAFSDWALAKHGSFEGLRRAWNQPDLNENDLKVPTIEQREHSTLGLFRDPQSERFVIDFNEFQQDIVVETLEEMARAIKEETGRKKLVTFFYGYYFELSGIPKGAQNSGHLALSRLLACPDVDILCSPISYGDRGLGGSGAFMSAVDSVRAAGKLWLNEDDTRTYLSPPENPFSRVDTLERSRWVHQRNVAQLLPRRLACWFMDLGNEGWLNAKELWDNIGALRQTYSEQLGEPAVWDPEVAVVVDEKGPLYLADTWELTRFLPAIFRSEFYRMGTGFRIHLLSDVLSGRLKLPKVTLFIGCFHLTPEERKTVAEAIKDKTAVWFYGDGFLDDQGGSIDNMTDLMGFDFNQEMEGGSAQIRFESGSPLTMNLKDPACGPEVTLRPRWSIEPTEGVIPLARFGDGRIAAAVKRTGQGRSIFLGTLGCPAQVLRNILEESGVWVYVDSDDVVISDGRFLSITATHGGLKRIHLPPRAELSPIGKGGTLEPEECCVQVSLEEGETRAYWIKR